MRLVRMAIAGIAGVALAAASSGTAGAAEVNVYWDRGSYWAGPAFEAFTARTGIAVNFPVRGEKGEAFDRLEAEGAATTADLVVTNSLGKMAEAAKKGLLAQVESKALAASVPPARRAADLRWYGIAGRARTIMYSTERVKPAELSTYEALGDPKWKGRLCLRTSESHYTRLLLAHMIRRHGEKATEAMVRRWVANEPLVLDKDSVILKAIAAGKCDVAISHTYYLGRALANEPALPVAPFWADQKGAGVHFPVAAAAVAAHAKNRAHAVRLLEYLTSADVQSAVVDANFEYPVNPRVKPHAILAKWGPFKADDLSVRAADMQEAAGQLAARLGYK